MSIQFIIDESVPTEIIENPNIVLPTIKKRRSVEYNGTELLNALLLAFPEIVDIATMSNVLSNFSVVKEKIIFNTDAEFDLYVKDLELKQKLIQKTINNFRTHFLTFGVNYEQIKFVYLSGKTNKHQIINDLNVGIDKKDAKADIYVQLQNDSIFGISCKQSTDATKSNYSVQKMLGPAANVMLTQVKKQFLKDKGYDKFDKDSRKEVNELFYPEHAENPYWLLVRQLIEQQKEFVVQQLIQHMECLKVPYSIYEFDGEKIYLLNTSVTSVTSDSSNKINKITFEDHLPYYSDSKGKQRHAAKLFYRLEINTKIYRVEVRWKGNIHNSSPQFQIHEE